MAIGHFNHFAGRIEETKLCQAGSRLIADPSYTIRALKEKGLPYIPYFVTGSHDWFCWPQMFTYFAEEVLWQ